MAVRFFGSKATPPRDDSLQISGAIVAPSDGPSPVELVDAGRAPHGLGVVRDQYERKIRKSPTIRMVPSSVMVEGRRLRFAVSDNVGAYGPDGPGSPPIWAVNIHGYFAGGGMYWRESARLAEQLGWRVINPSLPGFGGSDPLDWSDVSMENLANQVMAIAHKVDAGPVVLLGHSMGGAVAVQFAHDHPRRTLGVIYRDGDQHALLEGAARHPPQGALATAPRRGADGRHDRGRRLRPARPLHRSHVLDRARRAARHAPEHPHHDPDDARRQHAHGRGPAQPGAPSRGAADPDPQRMGLLRPHHAREHRTRVRDHCALPGAVGAGRPQLDAGPAPGPGGHPHASRPGRGLQGAGGRPLAPAHPARVHAAAP